MKFLVQSLALALTTLPLLTSAWIFTTPHQQFDADDNFSCTAIFVDKGEDINFEVGIFESCVVRLYNDASCNVQIGISSRDWEHTLTRPMYAFDIQDC